MLGETPSIVQEVEADGQKKREAEPRAAFRALERLAQGGAVVSPLKSPPQYTTIFAA